uniref:Uncharacterized protein n=1 Tax=Strigamia maritima TaxID=126957 RepID=T1IUX1_STRMM
MRSHSSRSFGILGLWSLIAPMNVQRSDASATTCLNKIYIMGGFNGQECMNTAEVYDPEVNQWTMIAPMRNRRSGVSCIAYHSNIYAIEISYEQTETQTAAPADTNVEPLRAVQTADADDGETLAEVNDADDPTDSVPVDGQIQTI